MVVVKLSAAALIAATVCLSSCDASAEMPASAPLSATMQSTAAQPSQAAVSSRNQSLIDSAEKAYQAGVSNYRDGHIVAARSNFDYAVDLMLRSGIDLKSDPALSQEFDHIVDAINTLELDALRENGPQLSQTHPDDAPVDVANDVAITADPKIRAQAEADLKITQSDIPLVMNDYVASYINFFSNTTKGRNTIIGAFERAGRYKDMIQRVLKEEGVPQDLIYLAFAESGFRPNAVNARSRAGGMWQFMPGDQFAPPRSAWYDGRFDPEQATRAYAKYMKFLYKQLGDWYLAMAGFNWGAGNVQRAVERTGYADFWELYRRNNLPIDTKNYVPTIIAVTIMAKNPKQYGLTDIAPDSPLMSETVTTNYAVDLRLVADVVNAPLQEIVSLNPSLMRMTTPPDEPFDLHLPPGGKDLFEKRIAEVPEDKRRYWRFHVLTPSESLEDVARQYRVSASEIAFVNQLNSSSDLSGVDSLVIPVAPSAAPASARRTTYKAHHGDTLVTVADRFGVTVDELRSWNHITSNTLTAGRNLYVAEPAHISSAARSHHGSAKSSQSSHTSSTLRKKKKR